jgi:hypothetical protein
MRRRIIISVSAVVVAILLAAICAYVFIVPFLVVDCPAVSSDNSGGVIAIYEVYKGLRTRDVYVQRIDPKGDFLWGEKGILVGSGCGGALHAISDGSAGVIVSWWEALPRSGGEPSDSQMYAAKIDSEGNVQWRRGILSAGEAIKDAVSDRSGGVIIAYTDGDMNMSVLKVDTEGNLPWGGDGVSLNVGDSYLSDIASDNSGGVIVVRYGVGNISAQRVDSGGNILWQTGGVEVCGSLGGEARLVSDGSDGAIIAYMRDIPCDDGRIGGYCDSDIYAQRIDAEGNVLWGSDGVPICAGPSTPNSPRVVADGAGGAIIFFVFSGDYAAIRARRIDADGHKLWDEDVELWKGDRIGPVDPIASDAFGGAICVWYGGAKAQRLDATGRKLWGPDGIALTLQDFHPPLAAPDGCGGVFISWSAAEFKGRELSEVSYYVQRVDAEGDVVWGDEGILLNP